MSLNFLKSNPISLRACILYYFSKKKPIFETFKEFSEIVGVETMDYLEFEFWFMRFATENFDFTYDKGLEPRRPMLLELPVCVLEMIFKRANLKDVRTLRQVCKSLKAIIEETRITYKKALLDVHALFMEFTVDDEIIARKERYGWDLEGDDIMHTVDFSLIIRRIEALMDHPKLEFEEFKVHFNTGCVRKTNPDSEETWKNLIGLMKKIGSHVTHVYFHNGQNFEDFMECFKPGKLKEIEIHSRIKEDISSTEPWKHAKMLKCGRIFQEFNMKQLEGFEEIEVSCVSIEDQLLRRMIGMALTSPKFRKCHISMFRSDLTPKGLKQLKLELGQDAQIIKKDSEERHYRIQRDGKIFQVKIGGDPILIERQL